MNIYTTGIALIASGCALSLCGCDTRRESPTTTNTTQPGDAGYASPAGSTESAGSMRNTGTTGNTVSPDNTRNNRDETRRDAMTPMNQSESSEHIRTTADIRRAVVNDDTLSTGAKNCKIITDETGHVWLRGVVESATERDLIGRLATQIAGANRVTNELEVE